MLIRRKTSISETQLDEAEEFLAILDVAVRPKPAAEPSVTPMGKAFTGARERRL
jgi:hypothetical protein